MPLNANQLNSIYASAMRGPFIPQNRCFSVEEFKLQFKSTHPQGADAVVFKKSATPGWTAIPNREGIIAILIGLTKPPSAREDPSGLATGKRQHLPFLKPGGALGVAREIDGEQAGYYKVEWTW